MACNLTTGRALECRDSVGGLRNIYFINYGLAGAITLGTDDEITDFTEDVSVYKFELKGTSNMETAITTSRENGTSYFSQTLNVTLPKLSKEITKEIKLMSYGRPQIVVEDYNGNSYFLGLKNGCDLTSGTIVSGSAMADMSGYTLVFQADEVLPANLIEGGVEDNPFAGLATSTVTIVT